MQLAHRIRAKPFLRLPQSNLQLPPRKPEQLEGKDADSRTDIFAFGTVLCEMITGKKAFAGSSQASLDKDAPPLSELQPMTPPVLERVVLREALDLRDIMAIKSIVGICKD